MNKSILTKTGHAGAFILLAVMAVIQLNDPDPLYWVGFYAVCALVPGLALFNVRNKFLNWACMAFAVFTLAVTIGGVLEYLGQHADESLLNDMTPEKPYIEISREFFGALIALVIVAGYEISRFRDARRETGQ